MSSEKGEKRVLWISFAAGLAFAIFELVFSIFSHSHSALMDAVYDSTELIFVALILFLTPLFHRPISEKRPYGFFQVESIFLIIKGFMMLSVTLSVSINVIQSFVSGGNPVNSLSVAVFQILLGIASLAIFLVMKRMNSRLSSPTVDAEILGWKLDIRYSFGIAAAFLCSAALEHTPLSFLSLYFDQLITILIVISMLPENIKLLYGAMRDIFLFSPEEQTVQAIKGICDTILARYSFVPVFYDVTRTGRRLWAAIYFEALDESCFSIDTLRQAILEINSALNREFENCSCELILTPHDSIPDVLPSSL